MEVSEILALVFGGIGLATTIVILTVHLVIKRQLNADKKKNFQWDLILNVGFGYVKVKLSKLVFPILSEALFVEIVDRTVSFWSQELGIPEVVLRRRLTALRIFFYDTEYVLAVGLKNCGDYWPNQHAIRIASLIKGTRQTSILRIIGLVVHELSHALTYGYIESAKQDSEFERRGLERVVNDLV